MHLKAVAFFDLAGRVQLSVIIPALSFPVPVHWYSFVIFS